MCPTFRTLRAAKPYAVAVVLTLVIASPARADDYDTLRLRWKESLDGGPNLDTANPDVSAAISALNVAADSHSTSMVSAPSSYLWSDLPSNDATGYNMFQSYSRLRVMAQAYATKGGSLYASGPLLAKIKTGLDWLAAHWYNSSVAETSSNWWHTSIGAPQRLADIMALLYPLPNQSTYIASINYYHSQSDLAAITGGSANLADTLRWHGVIGALEKNSTRLTLVRDKTSILLPLVTSGIGLYADGSYIEHVSPIPTAYTLGYGSAWLGSTARVMYLLEGSPWKVTDPEKVNFYNAVAKAFEPVIYRGGGMSMLFGRNIARSGTKDGSDPKEAHGTGHAVLSTVALMTKNAPAYQLGYYQSLVKHWLTSDTYMSHTDDVFLTSVVSEINANAAIAPKPELVGHFAYNNMDRAVHRAAGWAFGVSKSSTRVVNFELMNGENGKGWLQGDGVTYLYNGDLSQYSNDYFATVNSMRLPGVTSEVKSRYFNHDQYGDGEGAVSNTWSGGLALGPYGITGQNLIPKPSQAGGSLDCYKSWFMFDDEVVCLGSKINASSGYMVETVVENRQIKGDGSNPLLVNGASALTTFPSGATATGVQWIHLGGNVSGADLGYYFPIASTVGMKREARTGSWCDINHTYDPSDPSSPNYRPSITRNYLTLWLEHGVNPTNGSYQYVLLPNRTSTAVAAYASSPQITVLANSTSAHAVKETTLGVTGVNFWTDASVTAGGITSSKKAAVMMKEVPGQTLEIAVMDPTFLNTGAIAIEIPGKTGYAVVAADYGIEVTQLTPTIKFNVNVNGAQGRAFKATFSLNAGSLPGGTTLAAVADAYVRDGTDADVNHGGAAETALLVKDGAAGFDRKSYLKFNLNGVASIGSAKLRLYGGNIENTTSLAIKVYGVLDDAWSETGITWNNAPANAGVVLDTRVVTEVLGYYDFDVTGFAQSQLAGDKFASFAVEVTGGNSMVSFNSRDAASLRPQLFVQAANAAGTFSPVADAFIRDGGEADVNHGTETTMTIKDGSAGYDRRALLRFDLSGVATASRAKLRLYGSNIENTSTVILKVYGVGDDAWTESGANSVTWNRRPDRKTWELDTTAINDWLRYAEFDVTEFVQSELAGDKLVSFEVLQTAGNAGATSTFNSREAAANRPELVITQ